MPTTKPANTTVTVDPVTAAAATATAKGGTKPRRAVAAAPTLVPPITTTATPRKPRPAMKTVAAPSQMPAVPAERRSARAAPHRTAAVVAGPATSARSSRVEPVTPTAIPLASAPASAAPGKQAQVLVLLRRPEGATVAELMQATGWLPHSLRGLLSAVVKRKLGLAVTSGVEPPRGRVYRIEAPAAAPLPAPMTIDAAQGSKQARAGSAKQPRTRGSRQPGSAAPRVAG